MRKLILTSKFYLGILLFILSLIIGKITTVSFLLSRNDELIKWTSVIVYILTWPMMFVGIWWAGSEYTQQIKRYFSYKYYHNHVKEGTKKALVTSKGMAIKTHSHVSKNTKLLVNTGKGVALKTHDHMKKKTKQVIDKSKLITRKNKRKKLSSKKKIIKKTKNSKLKNKK